MSYSVSRGKSVIVESVHVNSNTSRIFINGKMQTRIVTEVRLGIVTLR